MATASPTTAQQAISRKPFDGFDNIFLNGKWRQGSSDQAYDDTNPYTNEMLVRIHLANERDLDESVGGAKSSTRYVELRTNSFEYPLQPTPLITEGR